MSSPHLSACGAGKADDLAPNPPDLAPHEKPSVVASALWIGTAAMLMLGIGPVLLGGLAGSGLLSQAGVGQTATLEVLGLAVGAIIGPAAMTRRGMRPKVATASLLLALTNLAMFLAHSTALVMSDRAVAGVLEGLMLAAVNVLLTHHRRPDRMSGLLLGLSTVPQALSAFLLPTLVIPRYGLDAGFAIAAAAALSSAFACFALVDRVPFHLVDARTPIAWPPATLVFVLATFLQMAAIGAAWNYTERLAAQLHMGATAIGGAVAGNLALQVVGALSAAWLAWRLPARTFLVAGCLAQTGIVVGLTSAATSTAFVALSCGFGLCWLGLQPFIVRELISLDSSRRLAVLLSPLVLLGLSAGSLAASLFVTKKSVDGGFHLAGALLLLAAGAFFASGRLSRS